MNEHRTIVTLYGIREAMVKLVNTIHKNLGNSDLKSKETENLNPILEDINSTGFSFKDMQDWESMSNEEKLNLENDIEKYCSNGEQNCKVRMFRELETGECYLSFRLNGENSFNWKPLVEQNCDLDWFIDNYEKTYLGDWHFIQCSIFKDNFQIVEEIYMVLEINRLIIMHPIHYGVCRRRELYNELKNLTIEKILIAKELAVISDNDPQRPFLLKKIEGIDFRISGIVEERKGIVQLWKDLGVAFEQDTILWREEYKEIDILAPLLGE